jgi:hypothetical protein
MFDKTKRLNSLLKITEKMIEHDEKELALEFISNARDLFHDEKLVDDCKQEAIKNILWDYVSEKDIPEIERLIKEVA